MNISHILATKGHAVTTTTPDRLLGDAIALLSQKRIGALVVTGDHEGVLGILSERDIVRALAQHGAAALGRQVADHMTRKVVFATRDMTVVEAMTMMTAGRFRHMPIVEDDRLTGLISIGDVVKHRLEAIEQEKQSMLDYIGTA